jgi:hypothetical protein
MDNIATGKKNQSSKTLLAWQIEKVSGKSPAKTMEFDAVKLPFQEEFVIAGAPTHREKAATAFATPTKAKLQEYYAAKPYGVDEEPENVFKKANSSASAVRSLADVVKAKSPAPKSLADYMK